MDIIDQLKLLEGGRVTVFPRDQTLAAAIQEIERLREAKRMAGLIADERSKDNVRLRAAIKAIQQATVDGRVCDDVAWFDTITTLYDYCDETLEQNIANG